MDIIIIVAVCQRVVLIDKKRVKFYCPLICHGKKINKVILKNNGSEAIVEDQEYLIWVTNFKIRNNTLEGDIVELKMIESMRRDFL